ncbi:MAG: XRE family transcriptional regulator [Desulfocapsa sp.]|nr:MAG: XRE family transcriptional regulator [Desulfocapsa sp.]
METQGMLASRFKTLRLLAGYKRVTLARRAGVSESSLKRFETSGEISLKNLLRLSHGLNRLQDFSSLFEPLEAETLAELKAGSERHIPKRGKF